MRLSELNKLRFAFGFSPDQARIVLLLYKEDRVMTHGEINKALPCGKMGRYTRRGDGVIRTQVWNIRKRAGQDFMGTHAGTGGSYNNGFGGIWLTAIAREKVRDVLANEGKIIMEKGHDLLDGP